MPTFWTPIYQDHFQKYFQKPFDIQVYHAPEGFALKLATHDWAKQGFRVYASMGLADVLFRNEEEEFGEVILFCDVTDKEIPLLFVNALFFILQRNIPLGSKFAIGFGEMNREFNQRYGKSALYFSNPVDNDDETFNEVHKGETVGRVFQAYFITPLEQAFLEKQGADAFELKFRVQFAGALSAEDRCELLVDKSKAKQLEARLNELAQQSNRALSVRRSSCV